VLTLTVNPTFGASPTDRRNKLHDAWKRLVKRILRDKKWKRLPYMAFLEKTKAGEPHLHILLRCGYIKQRWIARQMRQMIGAPICWIEAIKNLKQAAFYVAKYVTKEPAQFGTGKRYWLSHKWQVNQGEQPEKEPFDRTGIEFQRERWSEFRAAAVFNCRCIEQLEDGWVRIWRTWHYHASRDWYADHGGTPP